MYLTRAVEYSVQIGRARSSSFKWLLPLTGFGASESGVDCCILITVAVNAALVFVSTQPAVVVLFIRTASVFAEVVGHLITTSYPAVFSRAKAGEDS